MFHEIDNNNKDSHFAFDNKELDIMMEKPFLKVFVLSQYFQTTLRLKMIYR